MLGSSCRSGSGSELFGHSSGWRSEASVSEPWPARAECCSEPPQKHLAAGLEIIPWSTTMWFNHLHLGLVYLSVLSFKDADTSGVVDPVMWFAVQSTVTIESFSFLIYETSDVRWSKYGLFCQQSSLPLLNIHSYLRLLITANLNQRLDFCFSLKLDKTSSLH